MSDLESRLVRCFTTVFPTLDSTSAVRATTDSVPKWDSIAMATLVAVVEEEFDTIVPPEAVERFTSYEWIARWLREQKVRH